MADEIDLSSDIQDAATGPNQVQVDGVTVTGANSNDLIAAEKYLKGRNAASKARPFFGARIQKLAPPGAD